MIIDTNNDKFESRYYVYMIYNIKIEKIYIGSSTNGYRRKYHHIKFLRENRHHNNYLQKSFNKYGEDSFRFDILEWIDINNTEDKLVIKKKVLDREQYYIDLLKPDYNFNKVATSSYGINMKLAMGEERYIESKRKRRETLDKIGFSDIVRISNSTRIITQETKDKISRANIGRKLSKENIENIRKTLIGRNHSEETKKKMSKTSKEMRLLGLIKSPTRKVLAIKDNKEIYFDSLTKAAVEINSYTSCITNAIKYNTKLRGYVWKYTE